MTQTIYGGKVGSELLPAGHVLSVTLDAGAGAQVQRIYGGSVVEAASLAASTSYGPYLHDMQFRVSALAGATVTVDTAPQTAQGLNAAKTAAADSLVSADGIRTRTALIAAAEANTLTPGALIRLDDGLLCQALTSRYVQPLGPWFVDGRRWSVGSATSAADLTYTYLPPLAPNAQVEIWSQWSVDPNINTKRARIYLDGTLGGGTAGAQDVYIRNINGASDRGLNLYSRVQNRNDSAAQMCLTTGDSAAFAITTGDWITRSVSTNTSKLLRAMGETSKTGSPVAITTLTRSGATATAVTSGSHNLTTGDFVAIAGATPSGYNVDPVQVTVTNATTFTYQMAADPGAVGSGSPTFEKYNKCELVSFRVNIFQGL